MQRLSRPGRVARENGSLFGRLCLVVKDLECPYLSERWIIGQLADMGSFAGIGNHWSGGLLSQFFLDRGRRFGVSGLIVVAAPFGDQALVDRLLLGR